MRVGRGADEEREAQRGCGMGWNSPGGSGVENARTRRIFTGQSALRKFNERASLRISLSAQDARTRAMLLLQGAGWVGQFRTVAAQNPANLRPFDIAALESTEGKTVDDVFHELPRNPDLASQNLFAVAKDLAARRRFVSESLRHTASKVNEVHYYKYLAALVEDVPLVSDEWQPHIMAAAAYYTKGPADEEPVWAKRTREALRSL